MAKKKKLTEMSDADLATFVEDITEELFNLRFQNATGQLTNVARISQARKEKARGLTELRAREIAAYEAMAEEAAS